VNDEQCIVPKKKSELYLFENHRDDKRIKDAHHFGMNWEPSFAITAAKALAIEEGLG